MRRLLLVVSLVSLVPGIQAQTPPLLAEAIHKLIADDDHWAYTQRIQPLDKTGKPKGAPLVERYDPSKPYDEQWTLLSSNGHAPSDSDLASKTFEREKLAKRRVEKSLGDVLDLDRSILAGETGDSATFLVPILKNASKRFPADKLQVFMTVSKSRKALTSFSLQPREPFRYAVVVKVESGYVDGRLEVVEDKYAPTLVWLKGNGSFRLLGIFKWGVGREIRYADFVRVRPYDDRFSVKIGDIKALNF